MEELLLCPFCGNHADYYDTGDGWYIACSECFCAIGYGCDPMDNSNIGEFNTQEEAINAWNTRYQKQRKKL